MTHTQIFQICNTLVLPFWIILLFVPRLRYRNLIVYSFCFFLGLIYGYYLLIGLSDLDLSAFGSLQGVKDLFSKDEAIVMGWIHYLAFDLLVGNWIVNQAIKNGLKHWFIIPCLLMCFLFGPLGFLLFMIIKTTRVGSNTNGWTY